MSAKAAAIATTIIVGLFAFFVAAFIINRIEQSHLDDLANARAAERVSCAKGATFTKEKEDAYLAEIDRLGNQYDGIKRMWRSTPCVPITPLSISHTGNQSPDGKESAYANAVHHAAGEEGQCRAE